MSEAATIIFSQPELARIVISYVDHASTLARCTRVNSDWFDYAIPRLWSGPFFPLLVDIESQGNPRDLRVLRRACSSLSKRRAKAYLSSVRWLEVGHADSITEEDDLPDSDLMQHLRPRSLEFHGADAHSLRGTGNIRFWNLLGPRTENIILRGWWDAGLVEHLKRCAPGLRTLALPDGLLFEDEVRLWDVMPSLQQLKRIELNLQQPISQSHPLGERSSELVLQQLVSMPCLEHLKLRAHIDVWSKVASLDGFQSSQIFQDLTSLNIELLGPCGPQCLGEILARAHKLKCLHFTASTQDIGSWNDITAPDVGSIFESLLQTGSLSELRISIESSDHEGRDWSRVPSLLGKLAQRNPDLIRLELDVCNVPFRIR